LSTSISKAQLILQNMQVLRNLLWLHTTSPDNRDQGFPRSIGVR